MQTVRKNAAATAELLRSLVAELESQPLPQQRVPATGGGAAVSTAASPPGLTGGLTAGLTGGLMGGAAATGTNVGRGGALWPSPRSAVLAAFGGAPSAAGAGGDAGAGGGGEGEGAAATSSGATVAGGGAWRGAAAQAGLTELTAKRHGAKALWDRRLQRMGGLPYK